jgi:predicted dehydrogenase
MKIAIIGCGFVADYYMQSLPDYKNLELAAVTDRDTARLKQFCDFYALDCARPDVESVLSDPSIQLILNLTNPGEHYAVTKACLLAGKHVYSEKPLAMAMDEARELYALAERLDLVLACAPCSALSETAQAIWRALRENRIGKVKLVYAEIDDGFVQRMPYKKWIGASGKGWPYKDEFEVGCTLEHAGYYVNWLTAFFGPATSVTAFASCLFPDKEMGVPVDIIAPDFSVACITFADGVVARLTCSIVAKRNQALQFFGETGILQIDDAWDYRAPVHKKRYLNVRRSTLILPAGREKLAPPPFGKPSQRKPHPMHFCRGPSEIVAALQAGRRSTMPADYCLHNNEIVLAIHEAMDKPGTYPMQTTFAPLEPQPWALSFA